MLNIFQYFVILSLCLPSKQKLRACIKGRYTSLKNHEQSLQEMLRKARQQQHNRKAKQHNTTRLKQSFFKEKLAASGGTRNLNHQLSRPHSYQLDHVEHVLAHKYSYCSVWCALRSTCTVLVLSRYTIQEVHVLVLVYTTI